MALVAERIHNKHGNSIFIRDGLKVNKISVCEEDNVELSTVELPGVDVQNITSTLYIGTKKQASHRNRRFQ